MINLKFYNSLVSFDTYCAKWFCTLGRYAYSINFWYSAMSYYNSLILSLILL